MSARMRQCAGIQWRIPVFVIAACLLASGCRGVGEKAEHAHADLLFGAAAVICILTPGCHTGPATTWSARVRSPDGSWVAIARTQHWGGLGGDYTSVYLQRLGVSQAPITILGFSHQWPTMRLNMKWLSSSHLEVIYGPSSKPWDHVNVDFQVVKIAGIDVSLQKMNNSSAEAQQ